MQKLIVFLAVTAVLVVAISPVVAEQDTAIKIFNDNDCSDCHNVAAIGIGELEPVAEVEEDDDGWDSWGDDEDVGAPDLSNAGAMADAEWTTEWLRKKVSIRGKKHPERFQGSKEDLAMLTTWLATLKHDLPEGVGVREHPKKDKK